MRLGITIAIALLVLPTTWSTPLLNEGPAPFTYELVEGPNYRKMVTSPEVAYHDGKIGVAWLQNDYSGEQSTWAYTIQVVIRDGVTTIRHEIDSDWWPYVTFDGQGRFHVMYSTGLTGADGRAVEVALLAGIVSFAWTWPKQAASLA